MNPVVWIQLLGLGFRVQGLAVLLLVGALLAAPACSLGGASPAPTRRTYLNSLRDHLCKSVAEDNSMQHGKEQENSIERFSEFSEFSNSANPASDSLQRSAFGRQLWR